MPPVADQRMPRSNLSSTPFAGRIDDRKESDSPGLIAARPPASLAAKLGDSLPCAASIPPATAIDAEQQLRRRRRVGFGDHRAGELLFDAPRQLSQPYRLTKDFEHGPEVRDEFLALEVGRSPSVTRFQQPDGICEHPAQRIPV